MPYWFLPLVVQMVKNPRSEDVMHAWLGTLQAMVPLLPQQVFSLLILFLIRLTSARKDMPHISTWISFDFLQG